MKLLRIRSLSLFLFAAAAIFSARCAAQSPVDPGQLPAGTETTLPQNILQARGQYPEKLGSFTYFNFQKVDWTTWKAQSVAEMNKAAQGAKSLDAAHSQKQFADWLNQVNPDVFPRHLHTLTGASWKDAKGVHFDEWLD
jgi:hypothetical protein